MTYCEFWIFIIAFAVVFCSTLFAPGKRMSDLLKIQLLVVLPVIHHLVNWATCQTKCGGKEQKMISMQRFMITAQNLIVLFQPYLDAFYQVELQVDPAPIIKHY